MGRHQAFAALITAAFMFPAQAQEAITLVMSDWVGDHEPARVIHATRYQDLTQFTVRTDLTDLPDAWIMLRMDVFDGAGELVISTPYEFLPDENGQYYYTNDVGLNPDRTAPGLWTIIVSLDYELVAEQSVWVVDDFSELAWEDPNRPIWQGIAPRYPMWSLEPGEVGEIEFELSIDEEGFVTDGDILSTAPSRLEQYLENAREVEARAKETGQPNPETASLRVRIRNGAIVYEDVGEDAAWGALDQAAVNLVILNRYLPLADGRIDSTITTDLFVMQPE